MEKLKQILIFIFGSVFLLSCKENKKALLEIILDDFKSVNSSKNISINIEQNPIEKTYYFLIKTNSTGFEKPHYICNYKGYGIEILNSKGFDLELLGEISLDAVEPKVEYYNVQGIDDSNQQKLYVYKVKDLIVEKRMIFDIFGDLIDEHQLNIRFR